MRQEWAKDRVTEARWCYGGIHHHRIHQVADPFNEWRAVKHAAMDHITGRWLYGYDKWQSHSVWR